MSRKKLLPMRCKCRFISKRGIRFLRAEKQQLRGLQHCPTNEAEIRRRKTRRLDLSRSGLVSLARPARWEWTCTTS
jgi:hypothetical protein